MMKVNHELEAWVNPAQALEKAHWYYRNADEYIEIADEQLDWRKHPLVFTDALCRTWTFDDVYKYAGDVSLKLEASKAAPETADLF